MTESLFASQVSLFGVEEFQANYCVALVSGRLTSVVCSQFRVKGQLIDYDPGIGITMTKDTPEHPIPFCKY